MRRWRRDARERGRDAAQRLPGRQDGDRTTMMQGDAVPCLPAGFAACRGAALARCAVHGKARCSTRLGTIRRPGRHFVERLVCMHWLAQGGRQTVAVGLGCCGREAVGRPA